MSQPPALTDRPALHRNRGRTRPEALFLHDHVIAQIQERLGEVNRAFTAPAIVTGHPGPWAAAFPDARIVDDAPVLDLDPGAHDLIVHAMALHWADDPVGQLVQCRTALKPDGLFLAACPGGRSLQELRAALAMAESDVLGGLSPRVVPMGEIRDLGALLQRAGLALPVADADAMTATYPDAWALMRELRAMGEGNALAQRARRPVPRALFDRMAQVYADHFPADGGRILATFELIYLTGWAPDASQPQPLRPGSATARLADALGARERPAGEPAAPQRD
ncbi:SAM-dependent methyltransferase [Rhodobacteraceae bacterium CCMM004]|nr:SAM-dependent methyltransferase [Rhodobacteraceae bacterium CCMM004]